MPVIAKTPLLPPIDQAPVQVAPPQKGTVQIPKSEIDIEEFDNVWVNTSQNIFDNAFGNDANHLLPEDDESFKLLQSHVDMLPKS